VVQVVIVGGGISGLSAAYYLSKVGIRSLLVERRERLGGVITTEVVDGCVIEGGPDSFLAAKPWAMDLIRDLGLEGEVIGSNDHLRVTYIRKKGRLVPLPDGLMMMVPTRILPVASSSLLGWGTKLRMGLEWFRRPDERSGADRSVAEFIEDHYGAEAVDYLAEPLLAGVFGGDPARLSVVSVLPRFAEIERKYGSLTRGVLASMGAGAKDAGGGSLFRTLKGGLGQLVGALEKAIAGKCEVRRGEVRELHRDGARGWRVRLGEEWIESRHVVLACPAYEAARLVSKVSPELAGVLGEIDYSSSMTVALGYELATLGHPLNGFGFLAPKRERRRLIACTWVGTKFSHRAPETRALLRCFLGGATDASALEESDESIIGAVREELREIMGVTAEPLFHRISRWPRSMAQYTVGHSRRLERIEATLRALPNLHLAGNAYTGIGLPDCIRMGKGAAERISPLPIQPVQNLPF
jgi:oxygen-dependent protoporphyrinogen oxidase